MMRNILPATLKTRHVGISQRASARVAGEAFAFVVTSDADRAHIGPPAAEFYEGFLAAQPEYQHVEHHEIVAFRRGAKCGQGRVATDGCIGIAAVGAKHRGDERKPRIVVDDDQDACGLAGRQSGHEDGGDGSRDGDERAGGREAAGFGVDAEDGDGT